MAITTAAAIAMGVTAAAGAYSANRASSAARGAANAQSSAADAATAEQRRQYDLSRQDQMPWMDAGRGALDRLTTASTGDNSNFFASPDYNFRRAEGQRGMEQSAAARGGAFSGNALKALSEFNQNIAAGEYGDWWNRQAGLAGVGQAATNQVGQLGAQTANNIGQLQLAAGDARASGIIGSANATNQGINNALNAWMMTRQPYNPDPSGIGYFTPTAQRLPVPRG